MRGRGLGLVEKIGGALNYVASGGISAQQLGTRALHECLKVLINGMVVLVKRHQPDFTYQSVALSWW